MTDFTKEFIAEARESITEPGVERYICNPVQLEMLDEIERLQSRIAELEAAQRWIPVSERLPEVNGWYLCGMVSFLGATFTNEIYFDAVNIDPRWNNPTQDRVYCWLDGVPELPEVQE